MKTTIKYKYKLVIVIALMAALLATSIHLPFKQDSALSKLKAPQKVSVTYYGAKQLTVSWSKVPGAKGYQVYMAKLNMTTNKWGKYKKVKTIKKAAVIKYTKKKLKAGVRYSFKVKAVKGKKASKFSKAVAEYARIKGPKINSGRPISNDGAQIEWAAVKGAISYDIQFKAGKNGKVTTRNDFPATMEKLKVSVAGTKNEGNVLTGKTAYLRVRAITKIGKVNLASAWGKTIAVKVPKKSKYKNGGEDPNYYADKQPEFYIDKKEEITVVEDGYHEEGGYLTYLGYSPAGIFNYKYVAFYIKKAGCTVMYTTDGSEPSMSNGTKVTKGGKVIWQDRDSAVVKIRGYVNGKQVFYLTRSAASLIYWTEQIEYTNDWYKRHYDYPGSDYAPVAEFDNCFMYKWLIPKTADSKWPQYQRVKEHDFDSRDCGYMTEKTRKGFAKMDADILKRIKTY